MATARRDTTATKLPLQLVIWSLMEQEAANYATEVLENIHTRHAKHTLG